MPGTILIIDDSEVYSELISKVLEKNNLTPIVRNNPLEGIETAKTQQPDLILLDIQMPELDGYGAITKLKADGDTREIPVIFLTSLSEKADIVKGIEHGAVDYLSKPVNHTELIARLNTHLELNEKTRLLKEKNLELQREIENRKRVEKELLELSTIDPLTALYNRRFFEAFASNQYNQCVRFNETFSLIMIDIDDFKRVNDTYGHSEGDIVLTRIAHLLHSSVRKSDAVARYGGEEFILLCPHHDLESALILAEKIRVMVEKEPLSERTGVTISLGVTTYRQNVALPELIRECDDAMYQAKKAGKNMVKPYRPS